jgi:hypothetical protein
LNARRQDWIFQVMKLFANTKKWRQVLPWLVVLLVVLAYRIERFLANGDPHS